MFGRELKDRINTLIMIMTIIVVVITPVVIFLNLYIKSTYLFESSDLSDLLFSKTWEPLKGKFGFLPFIIGSVLITVLSVFIAGPVCFFTSIYLTQYAKGNLVRFMQPVIDILAGIPSVIYGVWGILVIVPFVSNHLAPIFNIQTTGYSLISGSIVLAIMIIPFILNILIEIFRTVPFELTEATLALGATRWEVIKHVLLRKARPGIISAFGLGISRAFGETIAVLMVAGNSVIIPKGLFDQVYPIPALIANNYGEMMSVPLYDSALMLAALILFITILFFNIISRIFIYRMEKLM